MTEVSPPRARLVVSVGEALDRAARFGKCMVTFSRGGATHERIGIIENVAVVSDGVSLSGPHHASLIDPGAIASVETDRSSKMKDKYYPRLDFRDAAGQSVFAIVGFEGLEPFDAALAGCAEVPLPEAEKPSRTPLSGQASVAPALPFDALERAQASGEEVVVRHGVTGFRQEWRGRIATLRPAMGFINIIEADFHLHLKDGSVSAWELLESAEPGLQTYAAKDANGQPTGLTISGGASAFVPAATMTSQT